MPSQIDDFVKVLDVKQLSGVGKVTAKHLLQLGVTTCGDLRFLSLRKLNQHFGRFGQRLYDLSRGIDDRPVRIHRVRKSLSVEGTFVKDLPTLEACLLEVPSLFNELINRMDKASQKQSLVIKALFLKMRFNDFSTTTIQVSARGLKELFFYQLCTSVWEREGCPVRLLGIGVRFFPPDHPEQQMLFNY